jgi:archaellum biogenesis protein FlaJ (TadC family)
MWTFLERLQQFVRAHEVIFGVATGLSVILLLGALIAVPIVVVRLPADYLVHSRRKTLSRRVRRAEVAILLIGLKNILGIFLILLGLIMLLTPGQGLLAILTGISVSNLPGKYHMECWIITRRPIWKSVQYLRRRFGRVPLEYPRR